MKRVLIICVLIVVLLLALVMVGPPPPSATWDRSPSAVVVEMDKTGNFYISDNHIPHFRLWGDGTVLWVDDNNPRHVFRGELTSQQTTALINDIIDIGFFGNKLAWLSCGIPESSVDSTTLSLHLLQDTLHDKYPDDALSSCNSLAPLRDLLARLADGAGAVSNEYVPEAGHLFAYPAEEAGCERVPSSVPEWSSAHYGFTLASVAAQDRWIRGDAIRLVWQAIAQNEFCAQIAEGDSLYTVFLTIPGVTVGAPDAPAPH